ncbi:hypothetical protein A2960_06495 [Candidatus Gottesmanbacteria bacterium RIFCSPLOWO2_01_FULL_39_12b]|uniref:Peptidase C39-like domain-containing protein n=1 Tax=Candidatus Gottesmanbacteria bacterium RIFCSPLOWO2_01_FULL_39_12b TaxID=1798388 RepID=A0A1F6ARY6_9BACT|nr:MAG: hypothetical protein A2960_06495 [Candidatus Gottesmanbacteria bacterium RIFCSPLOWO2_01_FULL_39_12b]
MSARLKRTIYLTSVLGLTFLAIIYLLPFFADSQTTSFNPYAYLLPTPTVSPTEIFIPKAKPDKIVYFSQNDPRWSDYPNEQFNIRKCGGGPTTIAQILAGYLDYTENPSKGPFNPKLVWEAVIESGAPLTKSCGVEMSYLLKVLDRSGVKYQVYSFPASNIYLVEQEFKRFTDKGNFVLAQAQINGSPHYFLVTQVDDRNHVWVYDVFYGALSTDQPTILMDNHTYFPWYQYAVIPKL